MAGWIPGFRSADANAPVEAQPFELVCECNLRHTGVRRKAHQRIVCLTCGVSLFVLPRDTYPPPPLAETIRKKRKAKARDERSADPDEPAPVRVSRHKRRRQQEGREGSRRIASAASQSSAVFSAAVKSVAQSTRSAARRVSTAGVDSAKGFWRFWTPLRLAGLGVCVLLAAITVWSVQAKRIEEAGRLLNPAIEEGLAALERGDLSTADNRLQTAVAALSVLGQRDRYAQSVQQAAREARALDNLVSESLPGLLETADEMVQKVVASRPKSPPEDAPPPPPLDNTWIARFEALYQGAWVVIEAPVRKLPAEGNQPRRYEVQFPIGIGEQQRAVELRADFEVFETLGIGETPRTVVLAGRLESCRFDEATDTYRVVLEPSSGFVWVHLPTYRRLGFAFSDWHREADVQERLSGQAKAIGVEALLPVPSKPLQSSDNAAVPNDAATGEDR